MARKIVTVGTERFTSELQSVAAALELELVPLERFDLDTEEQLLDSKLSCVVFDATSAAAQAFCTEVRLRAALADLQLVAIVDDPWGPLVSQAFSVGADDFLPADRLRQLGEKLTALSEEHPAVGRTSTGKIILADASRERRVVVGRHLRRTGLDIWFAVDGSFLLDPSVRLVVAHAELPPNGVGRHLRSVRAKHGNEVPWLVVGSRADLCRAREKLADEPDVTLLDISADASPIVFVANGMIAKEVTTARRSVRHPYATGVRWETRDGTQWGYTYNINRGGLYVRTLTPAVMGAEVRLEFRPPFGRGRVVVDGTVVWRQGFTRGRGNPPGFGVKYADELSVADGAALEAGYVELSKQLGQCQARPEQPEVQQASARSA